MCSIEVGFLPSMCQIISSSGIRRRHKPPTVVIAMGMHAGGHFVQIASYSSYDFLNTYFIIFSLALLHGYLGRKVPGDSMYHSVLLSFFLSSCIFILDMTTNKNDRHVKNRHTLLNFKQYQSCLFPYPTVFLRGRKGFFQSIQSYTVHVLTNY